LFLNFFSQEKQQTVLQKKIQKNSQLLLQDPDKAIVEMSALLKEAIRQKDSISELIILGNQCWYYDNKFAFGKSVESAKNLEAKARHYKHPQMEAMAHLSLLSAYSQNALYDVALKEFDYAMGILSKTDANDNRTLFSKVNLYISVNDVYLNLHRPYKALDNLWEADKLIRKIKKQDLKKNMEIINLSNIGLVYTTLNNDSAKYYVEKSMALIPKDSQDGPFMFNNYLSLAELYKNKKQYQQADSFYKKAEQSKSQNLSLIKQELLYKGLAETSKALGNNAEYNKYTLDLKNIQLSISENKNKSLHNIIDRNLLDEKSRGIYVIVISIIIVFLCAILVIYFRNKTLILQKQEKISEEYLRSQVSQIENKNISDLIEMAKNNDPAFMTAFNNSFPEFINKLKSLNLQLVQTELEFCAFLKLNLSSKDIARYKNIEPKTVQTKKYRIRKKLNIPNEEDIYYWFNKF
jgi:DNA-binding CsgD family transcriptional regulator